jgi:hypothetical protein
MLCAQHAHNLVCLLRSPIHYHTSLPSLPAAAAAIHAVAQSSLYSDWLSFTSRPWVQGPVDAFLGNTHLAAMMSQHKELQATVEGLVSTLDTTLIKVIVK